MIVLSQRTHFLYKGFLGSVLARVLIAFMQLAGVGIVSRFLDDSYFGIWMLLSQFMIIATLFDFGLGGGGLRNELSRLYVIKDSRQSELFLASFFLILALVMILSIFLFFLGDFISSKEVVFSIFFIMLRLPFSLYITGFLAYQKIHLKAIGEVFEAFAVLVGLYTLTLLKVENKTLLLSAFWINLLSTAMSFFFFLKTQKWKFYWISFKKQKNLIKPLIKLNSYFWLLNIFSLGLFSLCPFLIHKLLGLEKAGQFCLFQRIISLVLGVHFLGINALWSGFSDAYYQKDFVWMKKFFRKSLLITFLYFGLFGIILIFFHQSLISIWAKRLIQNYPLAILFSFAVFLYGVINIFSVFLNSQNLIKKQILFLCLGSFIHIFLGLYLGKIYGELGVILAFVFSLIPILISDVIEVKTLPLWSYENRKHTHS